VGSRKGKIEKGRLTTSFKANPLNSIDRFMTHPEDVQGVSRSTGFPSLVVSTSFINFCPTKYFHLSY
jgi:hypothetical protein